jgi:hypothetical protein
MKPFRDSLAWLVGGDALLHQWPGFYLATYGTLAGTYFAATSLPSIWVPLQLVGATAGECALRCASCGLQNGLAGTASGMESLHLKPYYLLSPCTLRYPWAAPVREKPSPYRRAVHAAAGAVIAFILPGLLGLSLHRGRRRSAGSLLLICVGVVAGIAGVVSALWPD